jgi:isopentenyl diphosphate isomerase/L-lactate dehydrogenase-like FMN-dependent dehydrogenase
VEGIEVYVDGGVTCGDDVLKCLAIGANCVFVGRGVIYANACEG